MTLNLVPRELIKPMRDMKHIDEMDENMNDLLLQKNFNQLTDEEREKVLKHAANEEEYNLLRQTLLAITNSFIGEEEEEFSSAEVKNDLMSQFNKKYGTENNRAKVIPLYRKPYFQLAVAASIALLVFVSFPLLNNKEDKGQLALNAKTEEISNEQVNSEKTVQEEVALTGESSGEVVAQDKGPSLQKVDDIPGTVVETKPEPNEPISTLSNKASMSKPVNTLTLDQNSSALEEENLARNEKEIDQDDAYNNLSKTPIVLNEKSKLKNNDEIVTNTDKKMARKEVKEEPKKQDIQRSNTGRNREDLNLTDVMAETVVDAPSKAAMNAPVSTESYIENNKSEMVNLLFTAF